LLTVEVIGVCKEHHKAEDYLEFLKTSNKKCEDLNIVSYAMVTYIPRIFGFVK
jgi:hypothetical protein